jgi:uncharacterized membrane protein
MIDGVKSRKGKTLKQTLPYLLLIGGIIGVLFSGILTNEKMQLLTHPHSHLACDLNPIVACGSVINTDQASAFGFPNPMIGLAGFGAVATVGGALLAGAAFRRWFWLGLQAGVTFSVIFITWLQYETIFNIHALCPFCMVVWAVTIPIFLYTTLYNLREGNITTAGRRKRLSAFVQRHHGDILVAWYLIIALIILQHFWYYWKTVL